MNRSRNHEGTLGCIVSDIETLLNDFLNRQNILLYACYQSIWVEMFQHPYMSRTADIP